MERGSITAKAISAGVSLAIGLGIAAHSKEAKADDTLKQLTPITTAEDVYNSNHWNQSIVADYFDVLHPEDKDKYLYLGLPIEWWLQGNASLKENWERSNDFYEIKTGVPAWIINGISKEQQPGNSSDTIGLKVIPEGIKTAKQYAQLEIISEKENVYTLKVTGRNEELNKRANLNINLIVFKREVNCENNHDFDRTTILKRVAAKYPLGALGKRIKLENDRTVTCNLGLINIPKTEQNQCQMVAFVQDMKTKEILAAGYTEMVDGQTALFNWDNLPECTLENVQDILKCPSPEIGGIDDRKRLLKNLPQYQDKIGLKEKVFAVQQAKDLKYLSLQLDYTANEAQIYQVLAASLNPELKDKAVFKYDPKNNQVDITFSQPINGDQKLFSFFIKINQPTVDGVKNEDNSNDKLERFINSVNFKMRNFAAYDSHYNLIKYQLREQKNYFPVRMCTIANPFDLDKNTWIENKDLDLLLAVFGSKKGDRDWKEEYDVYQEGVSAGRIDLADVLAMFKEIREQDKLKAEIKAANPKANLPELEIEINKILPPIRLTNNEAANEKAIGLWLKKREAYQDTIKKIKEIRKMEELQAV